MWGDDERSGVENAGFLLGIDENISSLFQVLEWLKAPTPPPLH